MADRTGYLHYLNDGLDLMLVDLALQISPQREHIVHVPYLL